MNALTFTSDRHPPHSEQLRGASDVATDLEAQGIQIHSAFHNGRRMVLLIARPPTDMPGLMKRRHPNGFGGITELYAADHRGCQLEWTVDRPVPAPALEVANG